MYIDVGGLYCCAVQELHRIEGLEPKTILEQFCQEFFDEEEKCRYVIFTTRPSISTTGEELKKYIVENNLGQVYSPRARRNPNSGNVVKLWVWTINLTNFERWYEKQNTDLIRIK